VDDQETIIYHIALAVEACIKKCLRSTEDSTVIIYSNKFNSGLFGVPWEYTEEVINELLDRYKRVEWVVYAG